MIEFRDIQVKYGDFVAIERLNLTIRQGEFFTFLGPSGCGKTTTLRTLVGFIQPAQGQVYVDDIDITNLPIEKREIGMVFQSYALFPTMTVYENLAFGLKVKKLSKDIIDHKIKEIAAKVNIDQGKLHNNVAELSGGQQQRVALARAIVLEPNILCLDEPLSNLDAKLRIDLRQELKRLQKDLGITTLYVTHDQEEALTLSDRLAVFNNGYIEQVGTPTEIYNHSQSEFVCDFIGDINVLSPAILTQINHQTDATLATDRNAYIRIEKILRQATPGYAQFNVRIKEIEYNGMLTKYMVAFDQDLLKIICLNSTLETLKINDSLDVFIHPKDILQY